MSLNVSLNWKKNLDCYVEEILKISANLKNFINDKHLYLLLFVSSDYCFSINNKYYFFIISYVYGM